MYRKTTLDNGVRILTDETAARTVATGIWITAGARDETASESGCAHFCEHMLFKGTSRRSAGDIARALDRFGGGANAFTSRETTCLHGTVLDEHLPAFWELLAELLLDSSFPEGEIRREAGVILQEIGMVEESPEELIHDLFAAVAWPGHPLAHAVLGRPESVAAMSRTRLTGFAQAHYRPENIIVAAAGHVRHDDFVRLVSRRLATVPAVERPAGRPQGPPAFRHGTVRLQPRETEQAHVVLGTAGPAADSEERYAAILLNIILGGNMSSRLFQEVREKRGLAYAIYSFTDFYHDTGCVGLYAAVAPERINELLATVHEVLTGLTTGGVKNDEIERARETARAAMYLAAEGMEARVNRLAANEMLYGCDIPIEASEARLAAVTPREIEEAAARLARPLSGVILGPVSSALELPFANSEIVEESE